MSMDQNVHIIWLKLDDTTKPNQVLNVTQWMHTLLYTGSYPATERYVIMKIISVYKQDLEWSIDINLKLILVQQSWLTNDS